MRKSAPLSWDGTLKVKVLGASSTQAVSNETVKKTSSTCDVEIEPMARPGVLRMRLYGSGGPGRNLPRSAAPPRHVLMLMGAPGTAGAAPIQAAPGAPARG